MYQISIGIIIIMIGLFNISFGIIKCNKQYVIQHMQKIIEVDKGMQKIIEVNKGMQENMGLMIKVVSTEVKKLNNHITNHS